jgi:outer membrane lipoprotein-sorting protein
MRVKLSLILCGLSLLPFWGYGQSDGYSLLRILQRYTQAYGGVRDADALSSLSVEGTIVQDGQTFDFVMRKKRPDSMRYRLKSNQNSVLTGYNGQQAWMRVETNGEVSIQVLEGEAKRALQKQAQFDSPLFRHLETGENKLRLLEQTTLNGRGVYIIEVIDADQLVSHYYLDTATARLVCLNQMDADGELSIQTLYRDYREIEGYPFAYEIETIVRGETVSLAKVTMIDVNPGLLSFYFKPPVH